jgi:hypothetical protein
VKNKRLYIVINSLVYFLLAYHVVVFSSNLFLIFLAKLVGFDAELFYNGLRLFGKKWTNDNIILVFFFGNLFSLIMALFFQRLYRLERKYQKGIKLFYLWVYIISISWFLGNIIMGAVFLTGVGAALIAFKVPLFLRIALAFITMFLLLYLGKKAQKHVKVSANLYTTSLSIKNMGYFFKYQVLYPVFIGLIIIVLLKLPNLGEYHYVDLLMLLSIGFFVVGLFFRIQDNQSIVFKSHGKNNELEIRYSIASIPMTILFLIIVILRIGLMNGIVL